MKDSIDKKKLRLYAILSILMMCLPIIPIKYNNFGLNNNEKILIPVTALYLFLMIVLTNRFLKLSSKSEVNNMQKLLRENGFVIKDEEGVIGSDTENAVKQLEEKLNRRFKLLKEIIRELKKMSKTRVE